MIRFTTISIFSLAFIPLALMLLAIGIYVIPTDKKNGLWFKLALLINSSLVLALGTIGCGSGKSDAADDDEFVTCYMVPPSDITEIPQSFEESNDWYMLENSLISLEYYISQGTEDAATVEPLVESARASIDNLRDSGLINDDDAQVLSAYVDNRDFHYHTSVCRIKCYDVKEPPEGKPQIREDIVDAMDVLRGIYDSGDIETPSYNTALANLEKQLKLYTGKEDNAVLRQLLLDITDGVSGEYY